MFTVASFVVVVGADLGVAAVDDVVVVVGADVDVAAVDDVVVVVAVVNFVVSVIVVDSVVVVSVVVVVEKDGSRFKSRSFVGRFNSSFPVTP